MLLGPILRPLDRLQSVVQTLDELFNLILLETLLHQAEELCIVRSLGIQKRSKALKEEAVDRSEQVFKVD